MSNANRPASVEILNSIPLIGEPKNSATIAPINDNVEQILSPLKINGIADGKRSFIRV